MRSKATPRVLMSARRSPNSKGFTIASAAPVNARAAKAPAVGQADAGSELPRYFLRSHARQLLQGQHLAEKRKLEARESSSGKRRRLESPFEQTKPAEDPEAASPGQRRSQGPPHGRPSSRWCGRRHCSPESSVQDSPAAPVNARAAKAPAVGQADAGSELPRYFLRSHARQLLQGQHLAEKRKLEARESSSGKRRRLESPFEQAKPAEDPEAASPGQRRSQGPPHGRPSSRWCGRRHCSPESSVQDSPSLPRRRRQDALPRRRRQDALPRRRRQDALPRRRRQDALSRRRREDALALRLWREELPRIQRRLAAVFGPGPSPGMLSSACSTIASVNARAAKAPAVGLSCSSGGENSRGKRRRLESPPEQAKPAEDPEAAIPGQRRSQGPPHGRPSSRWCGRRHCSPESSVQDCPSLPRRQRQDALPRRRRQDALPRRRRQDALPRRRRQDALPRRRRQDALSRRRREDALALRLWREELPRIQRRLAAVFGPGPSPGMLSSACSTIASVNARAAKAPAVGLSCSSGGENSRGKRRRLESPPEQAKPAEDPEAASPDQRRSQGPPHDTNGFLGPSLSTTGGSSPSCSLGYEGAPVPQGYLGRRPSHIGDQAGPSGCSRFLRRTPPHQAVSELDEASRATLQEELSPALSCRELAATDTRGVHFFSQVVLFQNQVGLASSGAILCVLCDRTERNITRK
ncbi:uncharacterized protein LOC142791309 [Rhipicephalus microplus]|uniref:uncharacterized protein LOC142791309 n=1 Tax=Rhipicephalus microplus TaxID=6941 RepID=UPI003F6C4532